tara:strand:- start:707 stop:835 length:129 start_codon:yes stop_codon:yes gene_type:complete
MRGVAPSGGFHRLLDVMSDTMAKADQISVTVIRRVNGQYSNA